MKKYENGQYIEMTEEEIKELIDSSVSERQPTTEDRLAALEAAMLEKILGVRG